MEPKGIKRRPPAPRPLAQPSFTDFKVFKDSLEQKDQQIGGLPTTSYTFMTTGHYGG